MFQKTRLIAGIAAALLTTSVLAPSSAVLADTVCSGNPWVRLYTGNDYGPESKLFCASSATAKIQIPDLGDYQVGLPWETWNDRTSSIKTGNIQSGKVSCFYRNINYSDNTPLVLTRNDDKTSIGMYNDTISSFKGNVSSC